MKKSLLAITATGIMFSSTAFGVTTFGDGGSSLQNVLDGITVSSPGCTGTLPGDCPSSVDVNADQVGPDKFWSIGGTGGSLSTIVIETGAYAGDNTFGIYDVTDTSKKVQLFGGSASTGNRSLVTILDDGSVILGFGDDTGIDFAGNMFGYYLDSSANYGGGIWYSDTANNADSTDHLVAYEGSNSDKVKIGPYSAGYWLENEYILAWEDLSCDVGCDLNYTDFVVMIESIRPVPAPATVALLGLGLLGMALRVRGKKS